MLLQRARVAESRVKHRLSNGPRRAQSNVRVHRVFCDVGTYVSCPGYDGTRKRARFFREFKVAPRIVDYSSLTDKVCLSRTSFLSIQTQNNTTFIV